MNRVNLLPLVAVWLLLTGPVQADMYRWTDDQGTVHFSRQPPATSHDGGVERLSSAPPARFRPAIDNGRITCGQLAMSWPGGPVERYLLTLASMIEEQQQAIQAGDGDDISDMRRCLVGWMKGQMAENRDALVTLGQEYRQQLATLKQASDSPHPCPPPASGWLAGDDARAWMDCHEPHERALRKAQQRVRTLRPLKPYWDPLLQAETAPDESS